VRRARPPRRGALVAGVVLFGTVGIAAGGATTVAAATTCPAQRYLASLDTARDALTRNPPDAGLARARIRGLLGTDLKLSPVLTPIVDDLDVVPPALEDAHARLDILTRTLALPAGTTCTVDSGSAMSTLHDVYGSPVFANLDQNQQSGFLQQIGQFLVNLFHSIGQLLNNLVNGLAGALGLGGSLALIAAILALVIAAAWWKLRGSVAGRVASSVEEPGDANRDPDVEWRLALSAAARREYREAVRRAFRSALLDVAWRGRLRVDSAWTTRELLQSAAGDADLVALLAPVAAAFDHAWYSGDPVDSAEWERVRDRCASIRRLSRRPRHEAVG